MRLFSLSAVSFLSLVAAGALAEDITLTSAVSAATVYPQGALVTRVVPFEMPAGEHDLIIADLPSRMDFASMRVSVEGATLGATSFRNDAVPSQPDRDTAEIVAARDKIKSIEAQIQSTMDDAARVKLIMDASQARIAFLKQLGEADNLTNATADSLRALVQMVGEETLAAREAAFQAQLEARTIEMQLTEQREELARAQQDLAALVPEVKERAALTLSVSAQEAAQGTVTLRYYDDGALWRPGYDFHLTRGDDPSLRIDRIAYVLQDTGDNWENVALTLSTAAPSAQTEPSFVSQRPVRIGKPQPVPMRRVQTESLSDMAGATAAEPAFVEEAASANFDGPAVTYSYATPLSIASGADAARIKLGSLSSDAEIYAQAVPSRDSTAFLMAEFTNEGGEQILPAEQGFFYVDGAMIGASYVREVAAGETTALAFGPIEGLQISRTVLNRNEGDRGIISRSNEQTEIVEIETKNLTGENWPIRIFDAVPFSEQEDLSVEWNANPRPEIVDVDNRRGILRWDQTINAGKTYKIQVTTSLQWPEGKDLQDFGAFR